MKHTNWLTRTLAATPLLFVFIPVAHAQENRTFVSALGDDVNNCRRTTPCKTYAGALSKTNSGGEIDALDSGGFGMATINKAVTIDGSGVIASSAGASNTSGIVINAENEVVILRNLAITAIPNSGPIANAGAIRVSAAKAVHIIGCWIKNFSVNGINFSPSAGGALFVNDSIISNDGGNDDQAGISIMGGTSAAVVSIDNTRINGNSNGVFVQGNSLVSISNSSITGSLLTGLLVRSNSNAPAEVNVEHTIISNNRTGIVAGGCGAGSGRATVRISNVSVTGNGSGGLRHTTANPGLACARGDIISSQNNTILGNTPNGTASATLPQQ